MTKLPKGSMWTLVNPRGLAASDGSSSIWLEKGCEVMILEVSYKPTHNVPTRRLRVKVLVDEKVGWFGFRSMNDLKYYIQLLCF